MEVVKSIAHADFYSLKALTHGPPNAPPPIEKCLHWEENYLSLILFWS